MILAHCYAHLRVRPYVHTSYSIFESTHHVAIAAGVNEYIYGKYFYEARRRCALTRDRETQDQLLALLDQGCSTTREVRGRERVWEAAPFVWC